MKWKFIITSSDPIDKLRCLTTGLTDEKRCSPANFTKWQYLFVFLIHRWIDNEGQQKTDLWIKEAPIVDGEKTSVKGNRNYTGASEKISDH